MKEVIFFVGVRNCRLMMESKDNLEVRLRVHMGEALKLKVPGFWLQRVQAPWEVSPSWRCNGVWILMAVGNWQ
jgi:hypothetical protein